MQAFYDIAGVIGDFIWGPWTLALIVIVGAWLSIRTKWLQVVKFRYIMKKTFWSLFEKKEASSTDDSGKGDISPFQALTTAMSATMGVGTIVGTATAIAVGGPGAIFWMWFAGFFGIVTKFAELLLAVHFREKNDNGEWIGGPMFYIEKGLNWKWLAKIFAVAGVIASFGIGNMVQVNSVAGALESAFSVPPLATGIVGAILIGLVIIGGIKRIGAVAEKTIPTLAVLCIGASIVGIILNITQVPAAFGYILGGAFTTQAGVGGFAGATIMIALRMGIARGIFSNEAGLGSAPIAHATAKVDHPAQQGFWGAFEVFVDTHIMCTLVALVILTSGAWTQLDAAGNALSGAPLAIAAFSAALPGEALGSTLMSIIIATFGITTCLGWAFYGEKCLEYLSGTKTNKVYRFIFIPVIVFGAVGGLNLVWALADIFNGLMLIPNLIGLAGLSGLVAKLTFGYFKKEKYVSHYDATQQGNEEDAEAV